MSNECGSPPPGRSAEERPALPMLVRVLGLLALVLCALTVYFIGAAVYVEDQGFAPANRTLATAMKVIAGACAIAGLMIGYFFVERRDDAVREAQQAGRDAPSPGA